MNVRKWGIIAYGISLLLAQTTAAQEWQEVTTSEEKFLPYKDRIQTFQFGKSYIPAKYLGTLSYKEKSLGWLNGNIGGIAMASDGTIVATKGGGTDANMHLFYWRAGEKDTDVIPLTYQQFSKETTEQQKQRNEADGVLWFFSGQCTFDRNNEIYITLGSCCGNGIFKVLKDSTTKLKRLNYCIDSSSLQIPPWDPDHAYIARYTHIWKFPLTVHPKGKNGGVEVFTVGGDKIYMSQTVMLDETKIITSLCLPTEQKDERGMFVQGNFTIYIDKEKAGYWLISDTPLGAITLAQDGKTLLRHNSVTSQLCEFELQK